MMEYETFKTEIAERIRDYLPEQYAGATINVNEIHKLNESYTGLIVKKNNMTASPSINLNHFYEQIGNHSSLDTLLKEMATIIVSNDVYMDVDWLMDYEQVKNHLFVRVSNTAENKALLASVPHKEIEDLSLTYHIQADVSEKGMASALITSQLFEEYGISEEKLNSDALQSSQRLFPAFMTSLNSLISELNGMPRKESGFSIKSNYFFVLTNKEKRNGAAAIFYPGVLDQAAKTIGNNFYILPSSIHEVILVPDGKRIDYCALETMVREINASMVRPAEFLSNHIYHYDAMIHLFESVDTNEKRLHAYH